jgi:hypothetical protein
MECAQMNLKRILLLTLIAGIIFGQQFEIGSIAVHGETPLHPASCKNGFYGYLHIGERTKLTPLEIGQYVADMIADGATISVYPESKSGVFVHVECPKPQSQT